MPYAFDELRSCLPLAGGVISNADPKVRYACALVAELAYYHVPQFEIDNRKRAMVVPCDGYWTIVKNVTPSSVTQFLQESDFANAFVVVERNVIAVGLPLGPFLFIAFRGTKFLFDWRINLTAPLMEATSSSFSPHPYRPYWRTIQAGRAHRGFAEESVRISAKLVDAFRKNLRGDIEHVFLTGHSLGGAVAALSERFLRIADTSVLTFGAPRYCDTAFYFNAPAAPPTQVQRAGDIVPLVPPRWFGYADHPYQFDTQGGQFMQAPKRFPLSYFAWEAGLFLGRRFEPHNMEAYRHELGHTAKVSLADAPLVPFEKLKVKDLA